MIRTQDRWDTPVLEMRANCERCDAALRSDRPDVRIYSYERTFCADCTIGDLAHRRPNRGGERVRLPTRVTRATDSTR